MTQFSTVNGQRIVLGTLTIPLYGAWAADLSLAAAVTLKNPLSIVFGNLTLTGAIFRQAMFAGLTQVRCVAGYAGWRKTIPSQAYSNPNAVMLSTILGDAASAVGEQVKVQTDSTLGSFYIRENAPAQRLLRQLAGKLWYIDPMGVTQVGSRTSTAISSQFLVEKWDQATNKFTISTEDYASWMPANTFTSPTVPNSQTISTTFLRIDDAGTLRLDVLGS